MDGFEFDSIVKKVVDSLPDLVDEVDRHGESMPGSVVDALGDLFDKSPNEVRKMLDRMKP